MQSSIHFISGGVTSPIGFTANGVLSGIKASRKTNDTALIFSEKRCNAAGVFTQNRVCAECVKLTRKNLSDGHAQAVIANAGIANACTGSEGYENAKRMASSVAKTLKISDSDVVVCSTGVIGAQLPIEKIEDKMQDLVSGLSKENHTEARIAIMTTDTHYKEVSVEFELNGKTVKIGSMCKGSGMIHINMGTMLGFITTDCAISSAMLSKALSDSILGTYNCVSVDGDTSTNDTLTILANGMAGNPEITEANEDYEIFFEALNTVNTIMAKKIAADGEGATRLIECNVKGAKDVATARALAKAVISSSLVKAMMYGSDANFGRVLCAMGYSNKNFNPENASIYFSSNKGADRYFTPGQNDVVSGMETGESVMVFDHGVPLSFDETLAKKILTESAVEILVTLEDGNASGTAWGSDLTYDYVKINGDYRS